MIFFFERIRMKGQNIFNRIVLWGLAVISHVCYSCMQILGVINM